MGEIEAAGDLVTGALWGRTVEPAAGEGHGAHHGGICLNCGTRLFGEHCHACGQAAHVHKSIGAIGHEIAHGVFHFEGKIWRTLPMLVWRPGELTRRYIDGERARFVSPLALFLFSVFLLFAAISWVGGDMGEAFERAQHNTNRAEFAHQLGTAQAQLAKVEEQRADLAKAGQPTDDADIEIKALRATVVALQTTQGANIDAVGADRNTSLRTGWTRLDRGIDKARTNPGLAIYKLQSSAYKYSWLLIPLSTPVVALLFLWRRRFGLYDHAIFVTFSLAFMMIFVTALTLVGAVGLGGGWITLAVCAVPPIHMYKQLRGTYGLRRFSAAWRMAALIAFAFAVLMTFTGLLMLHGLAE